MRSHFERMRAIRLAQTFNTMAKKATKKKAAKKAAPKKKAAKKATKKKK